MLVVGILVLGFWLVCNLIMLIKYKPKEIWQDLVLDQTPVGRISANIFYAPYWLVHIIIALLNMYVFKYLKIAFFAVARFFQIIYHSIFDIL